MLLEYHWHISRNALPRMATQRLPSPEGEVEEGEWGRDPSPRFLAAVFSFLSLPSLIPLPCERGGFASWPRGFGGLMYSPLLRFCLVYGHPQKRCYLENSDGCWRPQCVDVRRTRPSLASPPPLCADAVQGA